MRCALARDGAEALERPRTWQPDLVFLDIGLPGMDGYEVAREVPRAAWATRRRG